MKKRRSNRERGVALVICLFALLLLSAIGVGLLYMADTETTINSNYRDSQRAYFAALSGLQEVRERLMPTSALPITAPAVLPSTATSGGVIYVINPSSTIAKSAIQPWTGDPTTNPYFDSELCHENFDGLSLTNTGANTPCAAVPGSTYYTVLDSSPASSGANLSWRWVRITRKVNKSAVPDGVASSSFYTSGSSSTDNTIPICWDGLYQLPLPTGWASCGIPPAGSNSTYLSPVYRITALAIAPGGSRRMAQMEVSIDPPMVTNAAVDSQDHVTLNGSLYVNGYDYCSCQCTTDAKTGAVTCVDRVAGTTCDRNRYAIYSANAVDNLTGGSETAVAGQSPAIASYAPWGYNVPQMVASYAANPAAVNASGPPYNYSCTGTPPNCGQQTGQVYGVPPYFAPSPPNAPLGPANMSYQITYVPGSLSITANTQGNGILVVDGDLTIGGGTQFYGLILVKGVVQFQGGGKQATNIYGAVLAGQSSVDETILGGSANIYYDLCALTNQGPPRPPDRISYHEVTY